MAKKQIEDRAEDLGKEVGGYLFKQVFGSIADSIRDTFGGDDEDHPEISAPPKVAKKKGK